MQENNLHVRRNNFFDKFSYVTLLLVAVLSPIFFIPAKNVFVQFGTSSIFALGVILVTLIYIVGSLVRGSLDLPRPSRYILPFLAIVPFVYLLSGFVNGLTRNSFFGYTFDVSAIGFMIFSFLYLFLISVYFVNEKRIFYSYLAFVISSFVLALFIGLRLIFGAGFLSFGIFNSLTSTVLGNWNNVGIFFGVGVIISLLTFQMLNISKIMKALLSLAVILSLSLISIVNFKITWIVLFVFSFVFILYHLFSSNNIPFSSLSLKKKLLKTPVYSLIVLFVSLVFIIWGTKLGNNITGALNISNLEVRPSFGVTLDIAKSTLSSKPFLGSGPSSFVNQWLNFKPNDVLATVFWNTDFSFGAGLIPTFLVTTGVAGIISWLLFLGFLIFLGVKSLFAKIESHFSRYLVVCSFFVSLYLWTMTFFYVPSVVIIIITFFFTGLFLASVYLSGVLSFGVKVFSHSPKAGFLASLVLVSVFVASLAMGYGLFGGFKSLWYFQDSFYALNTENNVEKAENYMLKSIDIVPYDVYYRSLSEIELVKLNKIVNQDASQVSADTVKKQFSQTLEDAIKAGLNARDTDSKNYLNWVSLARVYEAVSTPQLGIAGAFDSSKLAYENALKLNPNNPSILLSLARLYASKSDLKSAKDYAEQAIKAKNNYLDAYFLLSQIEVSANNIQGAINSVSVASVINPTDPAIFFQLGLLKYNQKDFSGAIEALLSAIRLAPDYANATYFLGLSYEQIGQHAKAIEQFEKLKVTNPDNKDVLTILDNLKSGKKIFTNVEDKKPEKSKTLPVKETIQ